MQVGLITTYSGLGTMYSGLARYRSALPRSCRSVFRPTRALKTPQQRRCTPLPQHQPERFCRPKDRPTKADNPRPTHTPVGRGFSPTRALKTPQPNPPQTPHHPPKNPLHLNLLTPIFLMMIGQHRQRTKHHKSRRIGRNLQIKIHRGMR